MPTPTKTDPLAEILTNPKAGDDATKPAAAGDDEAGEAAAQDLIDAIKAGDALRVWDAFESLATLCDSQADPE